VRVEVTPGERFGHMIETLYGLARLGHTDSKGMPNLLQRALVAPEFSDVIIFRSPPLVVQRALFGALAPIAQWRGYRATTPSSPAPCWRHQRRLRRPDRTRSRLGLNRSAGREPQPVCLSWNTLPSGS
jgi:hypothetical protein